MSSINLQSEGAGETVSSVQNTKHDNEKLFFFGFIGFVALALVVTLTVVSYRIYSKAATDSFTVTVANILRLPALKVNGTTVLYKDYVADLKAIGSMRAYDKAHGGSGAALTDEAMSDQVLFRLVNNLLVAGAARQFNLTVEDKDVADVKSQILSTQFANLTEAEKALKERYGWNLVTYETRVIRPFILQNKLAEKIKNDPTARAAIKTQAETVLSQIKSGGDFAALAKQYGQDGTADKGGDLGWFSRGEMVPQFEEAVFALKKGELSQVLVESPFGFHIVRLDDRKIEKTKDDKNKTVSKEMVKASHILFALPTLDQYLNQLVHQAVIHLYIKIHDPFQALRDVVAAKTNQGK